MLKIFKTCRSSFIALIAAFYITYAVVLGLADLSGVIDHGGR